jgi:hypothetical protein
LTIKKDDSKVKIIFNKKIAISISKTYICLI